MKIQIILLIVLVNTLLFAEDVDIKAKEIPAKLEKFCLWWEAMTKGDTNVKKPMNVKSKECFIDSLKPVDITNIKIPKVKLDVKFKGLELFNCENDSFVLIYPSLIIDKSLSPEDAYMKEEDYCWLNSWIYSKNCKTLSPVSELPECTGTNGEFDIYFYWIEDDKIPLIGITTNGPACVPTKLYYFEPKKKHWVLLKKLCTA